MKSLFVLLIAYCSIQAFRIKFISKVVILQPILMRRAEQSEFVADEHNQAHDRKTTDSPGYQLTSYCLCKFIYIERFFPWSPHWTNKTEHQLAGAQKAELKAPESVVCQPRAAIGCLHACRRVRRLIVCLLLIQLQTPIGPPTNVHQSAILSGIE